MNATNQSVPVPIVVGSVVLGGKVFPPTVSDHKNANGGTPFHMEQMGEFGGLFGTLGRALQRTDKSVADLAHAQALAEDIARLLSLAQIERRQDAAGVVGKKF